jgi:hypothetical protein
MDIQKPLSIDTKTRIIQSFYLLFGAITGFLFITFIFGAILLSFDYNWNLFTVRFFINSILLLSTMILLIITYRGFLHLKRYARFTGLTGCILLMIYSIIWVDSYNIYYYGWTNLIQQIIIFISSIVLLIITLIYWKKL